MKQNITSEQLNELSEKGKDRLSEWWTSHYYGKELPENVECSAYDTEAYISSPLCEYGVEPLLSIGQMIEFLSDHDRDWHYEIEQWGLNDVCEMPDVEELCDSLWEAVKEVLEDGSVE